MNLPSPEIRAEAEQSMVQKEAAELMEPVVPRIGRKYKTREGKDLDCVGVTPSGISSTRFIMSDATSVYADGRFIDDGSNGIHDLVEDLGPTCIHGYQWGDEIDGDGCYWIYDSASGNTFPAFVREDQNENLRYSARHTHGEPVFDHWQYQPYTPGQPEPPKKEQEWTAIGGDWPILRNDEPVDVEEILEALNRLED